MKKIAFAFLILAVALFGATPAKAQGGGPPMTPQAIVDAFVATGGKVVSKGIAGRDVPKEVRGMCEVVILYDLTKQAFRPRFGDGLAVAAEEIGLTTVQFIELANPSIWHTSEMFQITMYFDKGFCKPPPSGTAAAQNPVLATLLLFIMVMAGAGFLFQRRLLPLPVPG